MASLKITKKHHKHINNPFPSKPKTPPLTQGTLIFNPQTIPSQQIYEIGHDFEFNWSSQNGGSFSISHKSNKPSRSIWATVPGRVFISAASVDTEVEESRGSFLIKDKHTHFICNHQTIEDIRIIKESDQNSSTFPKSPAVLIKGRIFNATEEESKNQSCYYAKYWMVFDQKNSNEIGFQVRFGKPNIEQKHKLLSPRSYGGFRGFVRKMGRVRRLRIGWFGLSRNRVVIAVSPAQEENVAMKNEVCPDFNRICITYSSEENERFYGFGEQFSHMDLKGKRVPIFVQEQGIGRGDQPITFAANLVSYRAAGDESTTYAPSPFYMTSKMRSLYLEGYNYSVFDLTNDDCVQIQVHGDMMEGRILNGNSPAELIERFTESIGRPQQLPEWIISGAVVGMQGGTSTVRDIWEELQSMDTPIS